ncbi:MAG TPA: hypothetical protein VHY08_03555 [Bacillota bacterium]|nr:hypothetical protein [Bacillota bacterium]
MRSKLIPGIILTMIILCLIPVTTLADEFQPLTLNFDSSASQFVTVSAASASGTSAEILLQGLAENERAGRIIGGSILVGSGVLLMSAGIGYDDESSSIFYLTGGCVAVIGVIALVTPSLPEKYYLAVRRISDSDERETAAASYLLTLSSQAKAARLINGITSAGFAIYYLSNPDSSDSDSYYNSFDYNQYMGITFAVEAIYSLLVKSPAEMAWESYEAGRPGSAGTIRTAFQVGINPKNGGLSFSYKLEL